MDVKYVALIMRKKILVLRSLLILKVIKGHRRSKMTGTGHKGSKFDFYKKCTNYVFWSTYDIDHSEWLNVFETTYNLLITFRLSSLKNSQ